MRRLCFIGLVVLCASCSNPTIPVASIAGTWSGVNERASLTMRLTEAEGVVRGTGELTFFGTAPPDDDYRWEAAAKRLGRDLEF
jgi:hypothetical protein